MTKHTAIKINIDIALITLLFVNRRVYITVEIITVIAINAVLRFSLNNSIIKSIISKPIRTPTQYILCIIN